jgi:branched-subunit amino acid permease
MGISGVAIAQDLLNLAWRTSPLGVVLTGLGLFIAAIVVIYENRDKIKKLLTSIGDLDM